MIQLAHYYWLTCDGCGRRAPDKDNIPAAWPDDEEALDAAETEGWLLHGGHYCPDCIRPCPGCDVGEIPADREMCYGCAT